MSAMFVVARLKICLQSQGQQREWQFWQECETGMTTASQFSAPALIAVADPVRVVGLGRVHSLHCRVGIAAQFGQGSFPEKVRLSSAAVLFSGSHMP